MKPDNQKESCKSSELKPLPVLCVIVPCYNEEEILPYSFATLQNELNQLAIKQKINSESYLCFIDDGSIDSTWAIIERQSSINKYSKGIKLSSNFGHQNALVAGLFSEYRKADCLITIDADLQDDVETIEKMVEAYRNGYKVVYGVRNDRQVDVWYKRIAAHWYYFLMTCMDKKTVYNHADFRLADREVIRHLEQFGEVNLYLRNIFPLVGFSSTCVYYERKERLSGTSKYPVSKLMSLAWQGITSFSTTPLKLIFKIGLITLIVTFALLGWVLVATIAGNGVQGWASTVMPVLFFSGLNMLALGVIGEYVGKIYQEVKNRPRFIIEKETDKTDGYK